MARVRYIDIMRLSSTQLNVSAMHKGCRKLCKSLIIIIDAFQFSVFKRSRKCANLPTKVFTIIDILIVYSGRNDNLDEAFYKITTQGETSSEEF